MTQYAYKLNYDNAFFTEKMRQRLGETIVSSKCSSDYILTINIDSSLKVDLDEFMNERGFSYLFEITESLNNTKNWGLMESASLPITNLNIGDHVYCSDTKKPMWWDGTQWAQA